MRRGKQGNNSSRIPAWLAKQELPLSGGALLIRRVCPAECRGLVASGIFPLLFQIKAEVGDAPDGPKVLWIIRRRACVGSLAVCVRTAAFGATGEPEGSEGPGGGGAPGCVPEHGPAFHAAFLDLLCCRIPRGPVQQPLEDRIFTPTVSAVYSTVSICRAGTARGGQTGVQKPPAVRNSAVTNDTAGKVLLLFAS